MDETLPGDRRQAAASKPYRLEEQVGFLLRRATQRHTAIFAARAPGGLTPTQFAALVKLAEIGQCSQNQLGRLTSMDAATIKGVVDRLRSAGLVVAAPDPEDRRRMVLAPSASGADLAREGHVAGHRITAETLAPLSPEERRELCRLLARIAD